MIKIRVYQGILSNQKRSWSDIPITALCIVFLAIALLTAGAAASPLPLSTSQNGTVSGDLYVGAFQNPGWSNQSPIPGVKEFNQTFSIPTFTNVHWARLETVVYAAGTDSRHGQTTVKFDGNGDGTYETTLGVEDQQTASSGDAEVYPVNDHMDKCYSDYRIWYNVTDLISVQNPAAYVKTENLSSSNFDGRVKEITLIVAYNDGDSDQVMYWVNTGHDYQSSSGSAVTTTFSTSSAASGWNSAKLTNVMLSSKDASYVFNTVSYTGANPVSPFATFGKNTWDVNTSLNAGVDSSLTYTHAASSSFKTTIAALTVSYPAQPDLIVTAIAPNVGGGAFLFANESNVISVTVKNNGTAGAGTSMLGVDVAGAAYTASVGALAAGASQTVTVTDIVTRAGSTNVTLTATADSASTVSESNETNNVLTSVQDIYNNGYKGKRFTGGSDINTHAGPFDGHYGIVYSAGNSVYNAGGWSAKTYSWTTSDLSIPAGATITSARLYQGYTWDQTPGGSPLWAMTFNNATVTPVATYTDRKGYGTFDYPNGLFIYDVTSQFLTTGNNMTITPDSGNNNGIYGAYLVVVYQDPATTLKKIWINDECDALNAGTARSATNDEATAYANFAGIDTSGVTNAQAIAILSSAGDASKSKFFLNSNEYPGFWSDYLSGPQIGFSTYDVTAALTSGANTAKLQSYDSGSGGDNMYAQNVILIVEKAASAPIAAFSATPLLGLAPLSVTFTDASTNTPTAWNWESKPSGAGGSWTSFNSTQNPVNSFAAGAYDIRLTATNSGGSNNVTKTQYLSVSAGPNRLATVQNGTVSGDLYVGAYQPIPWASQSTTPGLKTFTQAYTIPTYTSVQWARLYAIVYAAGTDNRTGLANVSFDNNGDGTYETLLGNETLATASTSAADVYPVNDHVNRQYSDYMLWYDVTSLINANTINAQIETVNATGSNFDGRLKELTLVIAYNDGDSDQVKYWVNEGHDYQTSTGSAVTTTFSTSSLDSGWASIELTNVMLSSKDASYTFNTAPLTGANPVSPYASFGKNTWDVKNNLTAGEDSNLTYSHAASSSFKTTLATLKVTYSAPIIPYQTKIGVFRDGFWILDYNGNYQWSDVGTGNDLVAGFGQAGDIPVIGNWNHFIPGDKIGVFRNGSWLMDYNGNFLWDDGVDKSASLGQSSDIPVTGDWNSNGDKKIGVFRNGFWMLDGNGNYQWDGPGSGLDIVAGFGQAGDIPVVGDWNGNHQDKIGLFRNGFWILDYNGNFQWNDVGTGNDLVAGFGAAGDVPVVKDWDGDGTSEIAVFRASAGQWLIDYNGNYIWDGTGAGQDVSMYLGENGDVAIAGDWNGTVNDKAGIFRDGFWIIDYNGSFTWDGSPNDKVAGFGQAGDIPVAGKYV